MLSDNVTVLVVGDPISGTLEFCCYMATTYLRSGERVVFVESDSELEQLDQQFELFGLDVPSLERSHHLAIVDCHEDTKGLTKDKRILRVANMANLEDIVEKVTEGIVRVGGSPVRVIFDSLTPLYKYHDASKMERFFRALSSQVKVSGRLTAVVHSGLMDERHIDRLGEISEGILEMRVDGYFHRYVRLNKFKGLEIAPRWVPFEMDLEDESQGTVLGWKKS